MRTLTCERFCFFCNVLEGSVGLQTLLQEVCDAEEKQRSAEKLVMETEEPVSCFQNDMLSKCTSPATPSDPPHDELEAALHELTQQVPGNLLGLAKN